MAALKVPVVKIGGGYLKAILLNGQETVWGRDEKDLAGRLRRGISEPVSFAERKRAA
jgi:hypothetical protein